ncbi:MAG: hypothetical protein J7J31_07800 [Helicobacteraceae bacterium]|nr:hypothetical protein [Helicobacteraceae bacterium]
MWHKEMQIALVEKDTDKLAELIQRPLEFETLEEMQSAQYLLAEAAKLLRRLQNETSTTMKKIKQNIDFLSATQDKSTSKLDKRF